VGAAAVAAVGLGLLLARFNGHGLADLVGGNLANNAVLGVACAVAAVLVLRSRPQHLLGWVFLAEAVLNALTVLATQWAEYALTTRPGALPAADLAAWLGSYAWWPAFVLFAGAVPLLYPDGRLPSPRWRPVGYVVAVATAVAAVAVAVSDQLFVDSFPDRANPLAPPWLPGEWTVAVALGTLTICFACGLAGVASIAVRMRRGTGDERGRLAWFLAASLLLIAVHVVSLSPWLTLTAVAFLPVALGVAMVRHGLYDGDRVLNRALVYGALSAMIVAVFAAGVGLVGSSLGGGAGAVVAAVVVALGLSPARSLVQRGVDRLLYGYRPEPYAALTGLGRRLTEAVAPHEVLPIIVQTVARCLHVPYTAVHLGDDELPAAAHGSPSAATIALPLCHLGRPVGRLVVGLRDGQRRLDAGDERLLQDFAAHAGVAVHAARLTEDLRRSRNRLLQARDEERHRIRRDLHDGLGPTLAGLALGLGAARRSADGRVPDTARLLAQLQDEMRQCVDDVRHLVAQMRPSPLAEVGLVDALRRHASAISARTGAAVFVSTPDALPALAPETELAAYRIAMEAMTNVARHASAQHCRVEIDASADDLVVAVRDDGVGLDATQPPIAGLGLRSMLERAHELGGSCRVTSGADGGTTVTATLPIRRPA
jgi:signal transduction histidine kinase